MTTVGSEIVGGMHLSDLTEGMRLEIETENSLYSVVIAGAGVIFISGHPRYCPDPIEVHLGGTDWRGAVLKTNYIVEGKRLEFWHPTHDLVSTSRIRHIRQIH